MLTAAGFRSLKVKNSVLLLAAPFYLHHILYHTPYINQLIFLSQMEGGEANIQQNTYYVELQSESVTCKTYPD